MDPVPPASLLAAYPPPMAAIARRLQRVVLQAFPDVIERVRPGWHLIGYDLPTGPKAVYFAYVAPEREHVHLGFEHGWAMDDPLHLLQGQGVTKQVRWLTFRPGDTIDEAVCAWLLHEAAAVARMSRGERALRAMDRDLKPRT